MNFLTDVQRILHMKKISDMLNGNTSPEFKITQAPLTGQGLALFGRNKIVSYSGISYTYNVVGCFVYVTYRSRFHVGYFQTTKIHLTNVKIIE